ncbi:MAG: hypothetical protein M1308_04535 [Actinobacteria bacterium]|nr:hypothetical protein [Actinomycetota bacterium]
MKKPKIGIIIVSIPKKISPVPQEAEQIIREYSKRAEKSIKSAGMDVINIEEIIDDSAVAREKVKYLIQEDVDCIVFEIGAWVPPQLIIDSVDLLNKRIPIILWAFHNSMVLPIGSLCHLRGTFKEMGLEHEIVYAEPEDDKFIEKIKITAGTSSIVNELNGMSFGIFGGKYMHMYTGTTDLIQVKKVFGVETSHINESCLVDRAKAIDKNKISEYSNYLHGKYGRIETPPEVEEKSIRLYFALKELANEYDLDFAAVKCMPEVHGSYCSHCLSVSKNLDEGFVVACEGDVNAALTMQILKMVSNSIPGFGDVSDIDIKGNILRLMNCGSFPTDFAKSPKDVYLMEMYDYLCPGPGTGTTTSFVSKPGRVTIARLGRIEGKYHMQISTGTAIYEPREKLKEVRERMPAIFIKLDSDIEYFLQNILAHHMHWVYGDFKDELIRICKILKIQDIIC